MKNRKTLFLNAIVLGTLVAILVRPSWGAERGHILQRERSVLSEFLWEEMVSRFEEYPQAVEEGKSQTLLVQVAKDPSELFAQTDWAGKRSASEATDERRHDISLADSRGEYSVSISLSIAANAEHQLQRTVEDSFSFFFGCSRPSTWLGFAGAEDDHIEIPGASFVASMIPIPGYPDRVDYCLENVRISMKSTFDLGRQFPASRLIGISKMMNTILGGVAGRHIKTAAEDLKAEVQESQSVDGTFRINWSVMGDLKDYWVRVDIDAGSLSIEDEAVVKAESVPESGTTAYVYAISPDGKTWFQRKVEIPSHK